MVIVVKKYLFLLLLLIIYVTISLKPRTVKVLSYEDKTKSGVLPVVISYETGENCNDLKEFFDLYKDEYYVSSLNVNDNEIPVSCTNFNTCIKQVYEYFDNDFEVKYMATGFKINEVRFLAYKENIKGYLSENSIVFNTW